MNVRRASVFLPSLATVLLAIALAAASLVPFRRVQVAIDALSPKGSADGFTPTLFEAITWKLRVVSLALVALAPPLFVCRRRVADASLARARDVRAYAREVRMRAVAAWRLETRDHVALLMGICVGGAALRATSLTQPVNYDEAFTFITYVRRPLWVALSNYSYPNNHLLHTALAHLSTQVFGIAPWSLRLPAFVAGSLLILLAYVVSRVLWGGTTGLLAAALVATSEVLIAFSVCARGYTIVAACFMLILTLAEDIVRGDRRAWPPLVIIASLGFYAVPTFLYAYLVVATYLLLTAVQRRDDRGRRLADLVQHTIATAVVVAVLYLPPMMVTGLSAGAMYGYNTGPSALPAGSMLSRVATDAWVDFTRGMPPGLVGLLIVATGVGVLFVPRRSANTLLMSALGWMVGATLLQRGVMPPRVWLFALPLYLAFAAAGATCAIERFCRWVGAGALAERLTVAALIATLGVYAWLSRPAQYTEVFGHDEIAMNQDIPQVVAYLKEHLEPTDAVVSVFPTVDLLEYYFWLHRLPTAVLKSRPPGTRRYVIVGNDAIGQGPDDVCARAGLPAPASAQVLARFEYNTLYEMRLE